MTAALSIPVALLFASSLSDVATDLRVIPFLSPS